MLKKRFLNWTKTDFKQSKIQSSKKPFKAKQVNIEAIQINFFLT